MRPTIIFDVDGTLLDTERIYMQAWREAGRLFGYEITQEVLLKTRAVNLAAALALFRGCCGEDFPYADVRRERVRIAEQRIEQTPADDLLMPHARKTLQWLHRQGYPLAVASSTDRAKTCAHLAHAKLLELFPAVVGGDMVERGKPNPDIFLLAARLAGAQPESCLVVGDSPADAEAACAAGMRMILIPDQVPLTPGTERLSWKVLKGLDQLPAAVETWEPGL